MCDYVPISHRPLDLDCSTVYSESEAAISVVRMQLLEVELVTGRRQSLIVAFAEDTESAAGARSWDIFERCICCPGAVSLT